MTNDTPAPDDGRDKRSGRFQPGNKFGRGCPRHVRMRELADAVSTAVDADALRAVLARMHEQALDGDSTAAQLLLHYVVGAPRKRANVVEIELPEIRTAADVGAAHRQVVAAAASGALDLDAAGQVAALIAAASDAVVLEGLEARLAALEGGNGA